ncbi:hypothetical protein [Methylobacterium sp. ARG-1]|uniref:hypothetical protein n=1 Tax=Methylobacterium sp. ARG-1 TaxID=1692501 RepID=UPI000A95C115|nr:hypothetical protein [Methylobacterium sp. ARG-1]
MKPSSHPDAGRPRTPPEPAPPTSPLTWWRLLEPAALDLDTQRRLRAALLDAPPLPSPDWDAACRADPTAAIGVAFNVLAEAAILPGRLDPAMSAILVCAALEDAACIDLLVHVLGRRARRRADLEALCLARAWCSASRRGPYNVIASAWR